MHITEVGLVLSASDLAAHHSCTHLTALELSAVRQERERPPETDAMQELLAQRGIEHEAAHLEALRRQGLSIVEMPRCDYTPEALRCAEAATLTHMRDGVDVIFQATFFDGRRAGFADFLRRVEKPSDLGGHSYEVHDTKLAAHVKVEAILQLCEYSAHVERLQGVAPDEFALVLGNGVTERLRLADCAAYYRAARDRFEADLTAPADTRPEPCSHCSVCRWSSTCRATWRRDDALCLVANINKSQRGKLEAIGIGTVLSLAESSGPVPTLSSPTLERLRQQARLQVGERLTGIAEFELVDPGDNRGLALLPEPSPGDLFFDIEGDPLWPGGGLEYLLGVVGLGHGDPPFLALWAHDRAGEKAIFEKFIDLVMERRRDDPGAHVYHYAAYEVTAMKRLAARHATREAEVDTLLRAEAFVDLYTVVRHGIRASKENYSLKSIEKFFMPRRDGDVTDAGSSVVEYERWMLTQDQAILDSIEDYNKFDCVATLELRRWLEARRTEAETSWQRQLPRPLTPDGAAGEATAADDAETALLLAALLDLDASDAADSESARARALLAHLLSFHRREGRSTWWNYFAHHEMDTEELVNDPDSIGDVRYVEYVGPLARSEVHRYAFDPAQEHRVRVGDSVVDPTVDPEDNKVGTVVAVADGLIDIKLARTAIPENVHGLFVFGFMTDKPLIAALRRIAAWVVENGVDAPGEHRAVRDLLLRRHPRLHSGDVDLIAAGETATDAATRLATDLDATTLAIQGPPGSGKTYSAALMAARLIRGGRVVGVTAPSHRAASKLLEVILARCEIEGIAVTAVQKAKDDGGDGVEDLRVTFAKDNPKVAAAIANGASLVVGTPWLFASPGMQGLVDVLFVDEAGQMSLANCVAAASSARNLVLLGDPQQLPQVLNGAHPEGAAASALGHVLGDHATIEPERGLFLDVTRRLHPDVCAFVSEMFYESRLHSHADCARQNIDSAAGLRFVPVEHTGCTGAAPAEVAEVRRIVDELLGRPWTNRDEVTGPVAATDIIVVTPFNAQVELLREALPPGIEAGTVDKFQGREGAVAIYTMACSTVDDAPRGIDFLYELNRLNVAVSRAMALAIVVASPALLTARCGSPGQVPRVNALCRFVEVAATVQPGADPLN